MYAKPLLSWLQLICIVAVFSALFAVEPVSAVSDFEKIVKGRCTAWGYLHNVNGIDCDSVWTDFEAILTDKKLEGLCTMDPALFQAYAEKWFQFTPELPQATLWSRTADLIRPLCKQLRLCRTLETTLPGYVFDDLDWCDTKFTGGKVYKTQCGCTGQANMVHAFWKGTSLVYSQRVSGSIYVILNGSIPTPFHPNSTFGSVELPNIKYPRVQNATVYLVRDLKDNNISQTCTSESIMNLKSTIAAQGVTFECIIDPPFVMHFLCISDPQNRKCLLNSAPSFTWTAVSILLPFVLRFSAYS